MDFGDYLLPTSIDHRNEIRVYLICPRPDRSGQNLALPSEYETRFAEVSGRYRCPEAEVRNVKQIYSTSGKLTSTSRFHMTSFRDHRSTIIFHAR